MLSDKYLTPFAAYKEYLALKNHFKVFVIKDAVEGIYQQEGDVKAAFKEMENAGADLITSSEI